jgi:hypothetical protein
MGNKFKILYILKSVIFRGIFDIKGTLLAFASFSTTNSLERRKCERQTIGYYTSTNERVGTHRSSGSSGDGGNGGSSRVALMVLVV